MTDTKRDPALLPATAPTAAEPPVDVPLLRTVGLTKHFHLGGLFSRQILHAVDDASFSIGESEILALVGESGSGKSTVARLLAMVYRPTGGEIYYRGRSVHDLHSRKDVLAYRSQVPMVFQDPYAALDPRIKAAAPACFLNSLRLLFAGPLPDSEMSLPRLVAAGLDHADFLEMTAPKPWFLPFGRWKSPTLC